jgi:hypothetical protein
MLLSQEESWATWLWAPAGKRSVLSWAPEQVEGEQLTGPQELCPLPGNNVSPSHRPMPIQSSSAASMAQTQQPLSAGCEAGERLASAACQEIYTGLDSEQPHGMAGGCWPGVVCRESAPCEQMKASGGWAGKLAGWGPGLGGSSSLPGLQLGLPGLALIRAPGRSEVNPFPPTGLLPAPLGPASPWDAPGQRGPQAPGSALWPGSPFLSFPKCSRVPGHTQHSSTL